MERKKSTEPVIIKPVETAPTSAATTTTTAPSSTTTTATTQQNKPKINIFELVKKKTTI